jgi:inhibitor of KinA
VIQNHHGNQAAVNEGYQKLMVLLLSDDLELGRVMSEVKTLIAQSKPQSDLLPKKWNLPVYYDLQGSDLLAVSATLEISPKDLIELHTSATYQVEFIGFLPGFPYLSGLPEELQIPRKETPSRAIAAGSVAIAAGQCGIYPRQSPGGWYVLGQSPLSFFDVAQESPSFLEIGDHINFYTIDKNQFEFLLHKNTDVKKFLHG